MVKDSVTISLFSWEVTVIFSHTEYEMYALWLITACIQGKQKTQAFVSVSGSQNYQYDLESSASISPTSSMK